VLGNDDQKIDSAKIFKIKYYLNLLPQFGFYTNETSENYKNEGIALSALMSESNELSIF